MTTFSPLKKGRRANRSLTEIDVAVHSPALKRNPFGAAPVVASPGLKPWSEDADALALEVLDKNDTNAHKFLRLIAERAGEKVHYAEIDRALGGWTWNQRSGLQGALGRTITRSGRKKPWVMDFSTKTVTMTVPIAWLFLRALGDRGH